MGQGKTISFHTLGCKLNAYDTEWYREQLQLRGYDEVAFGERADVSVVNTCTVTVSGDAQSRQALRRARRASPKGLVVAAGCYAQTDSEVLDGMPEVDLVVGTEEKTRLPELVGCVGCRDGTFVSRSRTKAFQDMDICGFGGRTRAFVKIQDGCDAFCSFCVIPFARGRSRSRTVGNSVAQVRRLVDAGHQEIVLTGVHIGSYGTDLEDGDLLCLLERVERIPGLRRYRISSIEPDCISDRMVEFFAGSEKFCRHLHIPLQSGDDGVLRAMRRPYTRTQYEDLVWKLAEHIPGIGIGSDVMVGFPGETDEAFRNTYRLADRGPLAYLHVFPYSPRKRTPAARMAEQVDPRLKKRRAADLRDLCVRKREAFWRRFQGRTLEVLFEGRRDPDTGHLQGVSDNYIRVFAAGPDDAMDRIRQVHLSGVRDGRAVGHIVTAAA